MPPQGEEGGGELSVLVLRTATVMPPNWEASLLRKRGGGKKMIKSGWCATAAVRQTGSAPEQEGERVAG